jgi:tetratricopeptide (TPR) repeat protein
MKKIFFVGAGISFNNPSGFPLASTIISDLLKKIAVNNLDKKLLLELTNNFRDTKRFNNDYLRFEQLIQIIHDICDHKLNFLKFIDLFQEPNYSHLSIVKSAIKFNSAIVTTNFDCLFENAILRLNKKPKTISSKSDFLNWKKFKTKGYIPVFKLHGSLKSFNNTSIVPSEKTIKATISAINSNTENLILPVYKLNVLKNLFDKNKVVFLGYSGGDDFDILPSIKLFNPTILNWVEHKNNCKTTNITESVINRISSISKEELSTKQNLFLHWNKQRSIKFKIIEADSTNYLKYSTGTTFKYKVKKKINYTNKINYCAFLEKWSKKYLTNVTRELILSEIYRCMSLYQESSKKYASLLKLRSLDNETLALINSNYSESLIRLGMSKQALKYSAKAVFALKKRRKLTKTEAQMIFRHAFAFYKNGEYKRAEQFYKIVINKSDDADVISYAWRDLGLIAQDYSNYNVALESYTRSINISKKTGDIRNVSWCYHNIAVSYFDVGDFYKSRRYLEKSIEIAALLNDLNHLSNNLHLMGLLECISGNLIASLKCFKKCLQLDRQTNAFENNPISIQHIGIIFLLTNKLKLAKFYFDQAEVGYIETNNFYDLPELFCYKSLLYLKLGNFNLADKYIQKSITLLKKKPSTIYRIKAYFIKILIKKFKENKVSSSNLLQNQLKKVEKTGFISLILELKFWYSLFKNKLKVKNHPPF